MTSFAAAASATAVPSCRRRRAISSPRDHRLTKNLTLGELVLAMELARLRPPHHRSPLSFSAFAVLRSPGARRGHRDAAPLVGSFVAFAGALHVCGRREDAISPLLHR